MAARPSRRGLIWALAASLALHVLTLSLGPIRPGEPPSQPAPPIAPRLAVQLLPPAAAPQGPRTLLPPTQSAARRPLAAPPAAAALAAAPDAPPTAATVPETAAVAAAPLARPADTGAGQPVAGEPTDAPPTVVAEAAGSAASTPGGTQPRPGSIRLPRSGRLEYAVSIGDPPAPVGRATYAWEAGGEAYRLTLSAETTGLAGLLRRVRVVQTSEGRITPEGLQPDAFSMDRGPKARNEFARFDWPARRLTFGYPDAVQTAALSAGAQDTLSLILQFAFVPIEQGRRDVLLTTGRRVYIQAYERVAEEVVETPAGGWRAWHLRRVRAQPADEGYDMWLATDRPYLPVRIRWTDRNGRVTSATLDTVRLAQD